MTKKSESALMAAPAVSVAFAEVLLLVLPTAGAYAATGAISGLALGVVLRVPGVADPVQVILGFPGAGALFYNAWRGRVHGEVAEPLLIGMFVAAVVLWLLAVSARSVRNPIATPSLGPVILLFLLLELAVFVAAPPETGLASQLGIRTVAAAALAVGAFGAMAAVVANTDTELFEFVTGMTVVALAMVEAFGVSGQLFWQDQDDFTAARGLVVAAVLVGALFNGRSRE